MQGVDGARRQRAPHEAPHGGQRRTAGAANRIGVSDQGHVAGFGYARGSRYRARPGFGGRLSQTVAIPQRPQLGKRPIGIHTVEVPEIGPQAARDGHRHCPVPTGFPNTSMRIKQTAAVAIIRRPL